MYDISGSFVLRRGVESISAVGEIDGVGRSDGFGKPLPGCHGEAVGLSRERRRIICYLRSFSLPRPVFLGAMFPTLRPGGVVLPTDDWRPIC